MISMTYDSAFLINYYSSCLKGERKKLTKLLINYFVIIVLAVSAYHVTSI